MPKSRCASMLRMPATAAVFFKRSLTGINIPGQGRGSLQLSWAACAFASCQWPSLVGWHASVNPHAIESEANTVLNRLRATLIVMLLCLFTVAPTQAQHRPEYRRGEQLYKAQCDTCHSERIHWRAERQVADLSGLKFQVRRWQRNVLLNWSEDDISAVSHYLNLRFYFFPAAADRAAIDPRDRFTQVTVLRHGAACSPIGGGIDAASAAAAVANRGDLPC